MRPEVDRTDRGRLHRTDWMALLSGLLFLVTGILFVSVPTLNPHIMFPVIVGGLACAGFFAVLVRVIRR